LTTKGYTVCADFPASCLNHGINDRWVKNNCGLFNASINDAKWASYAFIVTQNGFDLTVAFTGQRVDKLIKIMAEPTFLPAVTAYCKKEKSEQKAAELGVAPESLTVETVFTVLEGAYAASKKRTAKEFELEEKLLKRKLRRLRKEGKKALEKVDWDFQAVSEYKPPSQVSLTSLAVKNYKAKLVAAQTAVPAISEEFVQTALDSEAQEVLHRHKLSYISKSGTKHKILLDANQLLTEMGRLGDEEEAERLTSSLKSVGYAPATIVDWKEYAPNQAP